MYVYAYNFNQLEFTTDRLTVNPAAVEVWPHTYTPVGAVCAAACNIYRTITDTQ